MQNTLKQNSKIRSQINRGLMIYFNQKIINEKLKITKEIARNKGYNKRIVQKLYKKIIKTYNITQSGQK